MAGGFRKISRVGSLAGGTNWYLSDDCLLAAKRVMYVTEYRRFYLRDLESIVVWPKRAWLWRLILPSALLLAASLWSRVNFTTGAIAGGLGIGWAALELALGPTAASQIRTTGAIVDLPLVKRARSARKVLAQIDAAVRKARGGAIEQPSPSVPAPQVAGTSPQTNTEAANPTAAIGGVV